VELLRTNQAHRKKCTKKCSIRLRLARFSYLQGQAPPRAQDGESPLTGRRPEGQGHHPAATPLSHLNLRARMLSAFPYERGAGRSPATPSIVSSVPPRRSLPRVNPVAVVSSATASRRTGPFIRTGGSHLSLSAAASRLLGYVGRGGMLPSLRGGANAHPYPLLAVGRRRGAGRADRPPHLASGV
jgi:hypothetical protein